MTPRRVIVLVAGLLLLAAACKKTVEGETKAWDTNLRQAKEMTALYPGFKTPLEEQIKKAEDAWGAAQKVSDEEGRIKAMAAANEMLSAGFVRNLRDVDETSKKLRETITKATTGTADEADRIAAKQAADDAQRILRNVDDMLKNGAKDITGAGAVLNKVASDLKSAQTNLDQVLAAARKKQDGAKKGGEAAAGGGQGGEAAGAPAKAPEPASWKCGYCGGANDGKATKCASCGASK